MGRTILAVVVGYLVSAITVMILLTAAWFALDPSFAFEAGTTRTTLGWSAVALFLRFVGAAAGGRVAATIGRDDRAVQVLAGLILVVGLVLAVVDITTDDPAGTASLPAGGSVEDLDFWQAQAQAVAPAWHNFLIPFAGAFGVLVGGSKWRG